MNVADPAMRYLIFNSGNGPVTKGTVTYSLAHMLSSKNFWRVISITNVFDKITLRQIAKQSIQIEKKEGAHK